jgi:putative glutamine amidotransferase
MSALAPITVAEVVPTNPIDDPEAPLIGVIAPLDYPGIGEETRALIVRFTRSVLNTLTELGARFRILEPTTDAPLPLDDAIDGLLLLGGGDMDPALYGYHDHVPELSGVDRRCDERTIEAVHWGLDRRLPVFGICRGAQVINVAHGGTVIPDLGPDSPHKGHGDNPTFVDDPVIVEPDTRLAGIFSRVEVTVRNGHHQAVGDVAPALRVAARGLDGVIEAVEHRDPDVWLLGVQWHPEDTDGSAADRTALFSAFLASVEAARRLVVELRTR